MRFFMDLSQIMAKFCKPICFSLVYSKKWTKDVAKFLQSLVKIFVDLFRNRLPPMIGMI